MILPEPLLKIFPPAAAFRIVPPMFTNAVPKQSFHYKYCLQQHQPVTAKGMLLSVSVEPPPLLLL
jgi:hypothetical protein